MEMNENVNRFKWYISFQLRTAPFSVILGRFFDQSSHAMKSIFVICLLLVMDWCFAPTGRPPQPKFNTSQIQYLSVHLCIYIYIYYIHALCVYIYDFGFICKTIVRALAGEITGETHDNSIAPILFGIMVNFHLLYQNKHAFCALKLVNCGP